MSPKLRCPIGNVPKCRSFSSREELENHVRDKHGIKLLYPCDICGEEKILPEKTGDGTIVRRSECDSCVAKREDPLLALYYKEVSKTTPGDTE